MKTYAYPVGPRTSTVLGYSGTSKHGAAMWSHLDWGLPVTRDDSWRNTPMYGGEYLHATCKNDGEHDDCRYRVRYRKSIGDKWRGGIITDVRVEHRDNGWFWIVEVE